jgi:hypothetical protein
MADVRRGESQELLAGIPQHLVERGIDINQPPIGVDHPDSDVRVLEDPPEAELAGPERCSHPLLAKSHGSQQQASAREEREKEMEAAQPRPGERPHTTGGVPNSYPGDERDRRAGPAETEPDRRPAHQW